jgi:hypothetical protein
MIAKSIIILIGVFITLYLQKYGFWWNKTYHTRILEGLLVLKQIVHGDDLLDGEAVLVGYKSVSRDDDRVNAFFAPRQSLIGGNLVS